MTSVMAPKNKEDYEKEALRQARGRHHHGQRFRLADDESRGGRLRGIRHRRTRCRSSPRTARRGTWSATPARAHDRGLRVIIAGAGGAAHLPGVTAAFTPLPVIGVPIESKALKGLDSLLSIVQMPSGIPWRPSPLAARATPACSRCKSWPSAMPPCRRSSSRSRPGWPRNRGPRTGTWRR